MKVKATTKRVKTVERLEKSDEEDQENLEQSSQSGSEGEGEEKKGEKDGNGKMEELKRLCKSIGLAGELKEKNIKKRAKKQKKSIPSHVKQFYSS